jgi:hypothetical protein
MSIFAISFTGGIPAIPNHLGERDMFAFDQII